MTSDFIKKFSPEDFQAFSAEIFNDCELFNFPSGQSYNVAGLAFTFFKQKKYSQAQIIYEGLICANPLNPSYHVILGLIYYKTEQMELAFAQFKQAIDLEPDSNTAQIARYFLMEERNTHSAL